MPLKLGVSAPDDIARADQEAHGLRTFIHSLVGLDRKAACRAFGRFIADTTASANQLDFMNMNINELTQRCCPDFSAVRIANHVQRSDLPLRDFQWKPSGWDC